MTNAITKVKASKYKATRQRENWKGKVLKWAFDNGNLRAENFELTKENAELSAQAIAYRLRISQLEAVIARADIVNCDFRVADILNKANNKEET